MLRNVIFALSIVAITGCKSEDKWEEPKTFSPVLRVFMHRPNEYSFMIKEDGCVVVHGGMDCERSNSYTVIDDVPEGKPMWAKITNGYVCYRYVAKFEIHIRNVSDIDGGSYKPLKQSQVQTEVLR